MEPRNRQQDWRRFSLAHPMGEGRGEGFLATHRMTTNRLPLSRINHPGSFMKLIRLPFALLYASAFLAAGNLSAQELTRFDAQPGSKVKIDGTGNIHDWTVEGPNIGGHMELDPAFLADPQKVAPGTKVNAKVEAIVPVRSIKSGKKTMDEVMHDAMHQTTF